MRWEDQLESRKQVLLQHKKFLEDYEDKIPESLLTKRKRKSTNAGNEEPPKKKQKINHPKDNQDYQKLTVQKLRVELQTRGLDSKGKKNDLVQRLLEDDDENEESEENEEEQEGKNESEEQNNDDDIDFDELEYSEGFELNAIDNEDKLEEEVNKWWEIYDNLEESVKTEQLTQLLKENEMSTAGNREKLLVRCTFGILFGRTPKCPKCKSGEIHWKGDKYKCIGGNVSEWAKCEHSLQKGEIQIEKFTIPKKLQKSSFFKDLDIETREPVERIVFSFDSRHKLCSFKGQLKVRGFFLFFCSVIYLFYF